MSVTTLENEEIPTNRKNSSSPPNKYFRNHICHQNNRITRETITDDLYRYTWEPTKKVWIVGTDDSTTDANAVLLGQTNCPVIIDIAREKTYTDGKSYPVEIIGQYAFNGCAYANSYPTKTIFVTKQIKLIKYLGFSNEHYLTNFTIETGSQLQSIELYGLHCIGYKITRADSLTKTLILPSTLSSVVANGIYYCNLFEEIIYRGSHDLSTNSSLNLYYGVAATILRVTTNYNFATLLGNTITASTGDKADEVSSICQNLFPLRSPSPSHSISPSSSPSHSIFPSSPSHSIFPSSPSHSIFPSSPSHSIFPLLPFFLSPISLYFSLS